ncbi:uncharacterized protein DC041_0006313 [Schistosoma bovis]|uniref:Uncharacterized protein n=1 Tax=Schistosoma bovis TaxID=6184 RepID=A0A430Q3S8_SCHBO|nr:uncharacterized protein DC041_0006313 [Schistosoma bovis]
MIKLTKKFLFNVFLLKVNSLKFIKNVKTCFLFLISWLAAIGLSLVAISFPLGITATCLLNTLCRIKRYVEYIEARKQMLESQVTETHPDKVVYK